MQALVLSPVSAKNQNSPALSGFLLSCAVGLVAFSAGLDVEEFGPRDF
ncbi:hypothetical protein [Streptosporangium sp. NPDC051022]